MSQNNDLSQRKENSRKTDHNDSDEPSNKRLKTDASASSSSAPQAVPSTAANLQNNNITPPLVQNAAERNVERPQPVAPSLQSGQLLLTVQVQATGTTQMIVAQIRLPDGRTYQEQLMIPQVQLGTILTYRLPVTIESSSNIRPGVPVPSNQPAPRMNVPQAVPSTQSGQLLQTIIVHATGTSQMIHSEIRLPDGRTSQSKLVIPQVQPGTILTYRLAVAIESSFNFRPGVPVPSNQPAPRMNIPPNLQQPIYRGPIPVTGPSQSHPNLRPRVPVPSNQPAPRMNVPPNLQQPPVAGPSQSHPNLTPRVPVPSNQPALVTSSTQGKPILCGHPKCNNLSVNFVESNKHARECHADLDLRCDICGLKLVNCDCKKWNDLWD